MPRTNLGRNLAGMALAGVLAFLAGCVPPPAPSPVSRTNLHNTQDGNQIPVTASVTETRYPANDPGGQAYYPPPGGPLPPNYPSGLPQTYGNMPPQGNSYPPPAPYGAPAAVTTRYFDSNVVPVGATGVAPAGPATAWPNDAGNAPGGPPPGYAGPGPMPPITIGPVAASPKKSDEDDEWDISHLAPDYTWKKFKEAVGWGPDQRLATAAYDKGRALFNAKNYDEAAKEFYTASWRWPDSTMEEDAMFLMGESYFFSDHYGSAKTRTSTC